MSVSLWEREIGNEDEEENDINNKLWTKTFPNRAAALDFLSKYLDQISSKTKNKNKNKNKSCKIKKLDDPLSPPPSSSP